MKIRIEINKTENKESVEKIVDFWGVWWKPKALSLKRSIKSEPLARLAWIKRRH